MLVGSSTLLYQIFTILRKLNSIEMLIAQNSHLSICRLVICICTLQLNLLSDIPKADSDIQWPQLLMVAATSSSVRWVQAKCHHPQRCIATHVSLRERGISASWTLVIQKDPCQKTGQILVEQVCSLSFSGFDA